MPRLERAGGDCGQCGLALAFQQGRLGEGDLEVCRICQSEGRPGARRCQNILTAMGREADRLARVEVDNATWAERRFGL